MKTHTTAAGAVALVVLTFGLLPDAHPADLPSARLAIQSGGDQPGDTVLVQLELQWDGRPELHVPGRPELTLPKGATLRTGRTASRFDGTKTRWSADLVVTLPDGGAPWELGPAEVELKAGASAGQTIRTAPVSIGRPSEWRRVLGQGVGSGALLLLVGLYFFFRDRHLGLQFHDPQMAALEELLRQADPTESEACWNTLIELRLALDGASGDNATLPEPDVLRDRLDRARYGGEEITESECLDLLSALRAAVEE